MCSLHCYGWWFVQIVCAWLFTSWSWRDNIQLSRLMQKLSPVSFLARSCWQSFHTWYTIQAKLCSGQYKDHFPAVSLPLCFAARHGNSVSLYSGRCIINCILQFVNVFCQSKTINDVWLYTSRDNNDETPSVSDLQISWKSRSVIMCKIPHVKQGNVLIHSIRGLFLGIVHT